MTQPSDALVLHNRHTGERLEARRVVRDGQMCLHLRGTLPARQSGPPLHVHYQQLEQGTVTAGTLSAVVDGQEIRIGPGGSATFPAGAAHRWWNDEAETLAFEGLTVPAVDLDRYLQAVFEVMNHGAPDRPPLFYMAHIARRHWRTQAVLLMPRALQAIALPLIVLLGTILGRYRGTNWPGAPARCTGAPLVDDV